MEKPTDLKIPRWKLRDDRILVLADEVQQKIGNLYMPEDTQEKQMRTGVVVLAGPGLTDKPMQTQIDDVVVFTRHAGSLMVYEGKEFFMMRETDIAAVTDEKVTKATEVVEEPTDLEQALELVVAEVQEQIEEHGYTAKHDDKFNSNGQLAAGAAYAITGDPANWPSTWNPQYRERIDAKDDDEKLIVATALLVSELRRRIRKESKEAESQLVDVNIATPREEDQP